MTDHSNSSLEIQRLREELARSQAELAQAHAQLRKLNLVQGSSWRGILGMLDALPFCVAYTDRHYRYRYINQNYQLWFGLAPDDIYGKTVAEVIGDRAYQSVKSYIDRVLSGEIVTYETNMPYVQGGARYVRATLIPDRSGDALVQGYYAIILDLSDRHQLELALRESQQKYQTLFEILPIGVSITDAQGNLIEANPESANILGISTEEHLGRTYDEPDWHIIRPDGSLMPASEYPSVRALQEQQSIRNIEQGIVRSDGSIHWLVTSAAPIPLANYGVAIAYVDVTERKQIDAELRRSEEQRKLAIDFSNTGCWEFDVRTGNAIWNDNHYRLMGLNPATDPSSYANWQSVVYPDDLSRTKATFDHALMTKSDLEAEYRVIHPDGHIYWILTRGRGIYDADGQAERMVGVTLDITDRKMAEEALKQSNAHYQSLADALPQSLFREDCEGRCTFMNQSFLNLLNKTLDECLGKTVYDLYPRELAERYILETRQVLALGSVIDVIYPHKINPEDEPRFVQCVKAPVRDSDGNIVGVQGIFWDVTERIRLANALHESETKLNAVLKTTAAAIVSAQVFADRTYRYDYCSAGCETILGYRADELIANHSLWLSRVHPDDIQSLILPLFEDIFAERSYQLECRFQHANGSWRWLMVSATSQWDDAIQGWRVTKLQTDITDRKRLEQELQDANALNDFVIQSIGEGIWNWDIVNNSATFSDRYWEILGCDPVNYADGAFELGLQQVDTDDRTLIQRALDAHLKNRKRFDIEIRLQHRDRHYIWVRSRGQAIWDDQGKPLRMIGTIEDITDRKMAETVLRQHEQEFRALAENSPDSIMRCDRDFRFIYVNPTVTALTGISEQNFLGKTCYDMKFPEPLVELWHQAIDTVFNTKKERFLEYNMQLASGWRDFQSRIVPEMGNDGDVCSVLIVARDITELKQAQLAISRRAEREYALRLMAQHIQQSLDLTEVLATAVAEVQRMLNADRTLIFRLNSDRSGVVIQEAVNSPYPVTLEMRWEDECFPHACYESYCQSQVRIVPDITVDQWGECLVEFMQQTGAQSKIVAPITQTQSDGSVRVWGLLIVHACSEKRVWQPDEADTLQQVADRLAIAIQHSELHAQLHQQTRQLQQANQLLAEINIRLNDLSNRDGLTQVANRRCFDRVLQQEWQRLQRNQEPISLILLDVDFFKVYNDLHGHLAGDDCLIRISRAVEKLLKRKTDLLARYGGEEFVVILPQTPVAGAMQMAEAIRQVTIDLQIFHSLVDDRPRCVTVSLGVAMQIPNNGSSPKQLIDAADRALYQAKSQGRNRWVFADEHPSVEQES